MYTSKRNKHINERKSILDKPNEIILNTTGTQLPTRELKSLAILLTPPVGIGFLIYDSFFSVKQHNEDEQQKIYYETWKKLYIKPRCREVNALKMQKGVTMKEAFEEIAEIRRWEFPKSKFDSELVKKYNIKPE